MDLDYWLALAGGLATIAAGVIGGYRKVLKPMWTGWVERRALAKRIPQMVQTIFAEVRPNGGGSLRDMIERIESRQVLHEQRSRIVMIDAGIAVFHTDTKGQFSDVNRAFERLVGRTAAELVGFGWVNAVHHADAERVVQSWTWAVEDHREFTCRFRILTPEGEPLEVQCNAYPVRGPKEPFIGYYGIVRELERESR